MIDQDEWTDAEAVKARARVAYAALTEDERDALLLCDDESFIDTISLAHQLAHPNPRKRADCLRARSILHRLEVLGAIHRIPDTERPVIFDDGTTVTIMRVRAAWDLDGVWADIVAEISYLPEHESHATD